MKDRSFYGEGPPREETGVTAWANVWDFHELDYTHRRFGRIFICADGKVIDWMNEDK